MSLDNRIEAVKVAIIEKMEGQSYLRPGVLISSLAEATGEDAISVRQALARLAKAGWLSGVATDGTPFGQVRITGEVPAKVIDPAQACWTDVMRAASFADYEIKALAGCWKNLNGFKHEDMKALANGLLRLKNEQATLEGLPSYLVSARYLLGSSKILSEMGSRALNAFGIDVSCFPNHPPYVVVGGCAGPQTVVLVENPASFELAIKTDAFNRCAFIATYGFGFSKQNDDHGKQLAELAETGFDHSITLMRQGSNCPPARALLTHPNIVFWGDLDMAGMQIFERIASKVPHIQLSALYGPMVKAIQDPERRHPYVAATGSGKPGQKLFQSSRPDVRTMLAYCEQYAVDQEIVLPEEIELLAGQALDVSNLGKIIPPF